MKPVKFQIDDSLWERFFRIFPGHGERSAILRKVVRHIVVSHAELPPLEEVVATRVMEDWKAPGGGENE